MDPGAPQLLAGGGMGDVVRMHGAPARRLSRGADELALDVLHLRDNAGLSFGRIAAILTEKHGQPVTKNGCISLARRFGDDVALPCLCEEPENQDGGMPERWWAK